MGNGIRRIRSLGVLRVTVTAGGAARFTYRLRAAARDPSKPSYLPVETQVAFSEATPRP